MSAVVEFHGVEEDVPELHLAVVRGKEDLTIKVASINRVNESSRSAIAVVACRARRSRTI